MKLHLCSAPRGSSIVSNCALVLGLSFLAACPSEPNTAPQALAPQPASDSITPSLVDEVDLVSPEDALLQANEEINDDNVLDALDALEGEVE